MSDFAGSEAVDTGSGSSEPVAHADLVAAARSAMADDEPTPARVAADVLETMADGDSEAEEADPEPKVAKAKPVQAADDDIDPREVIRSRMEKARAAKQAKAEARRQAEMAERLREYERMQAERAPQASQFDVDGFKTKLKTSPLTALQELGINLDEFTQAALEENTPQSKMLAQMQALQAKIDAFERQQKEAEETQRRKQEEAETLREQQEFCSMITSEDYPSLYEWFSDDPYALVREAEGVAREFLSRGGDPDDLGDDDIAWFLEQKYSKKLGAIKGKSAAKAAAQPAPATSKPRSPSQASASETRLGGPKNLYDMSRDEQTAMLIEVARQEMHKSAN
jgi:hypothetical protein